MTTFRTFEVSDPAFEHGGLRHVTVSSPALRRRGDVTFHIPPHSGDGRLPLVVLLHGVYGSHWSWAHQGGAHLTAARMMATGALPPHVLAMPSDGLWGDGSGYVPHAAHDPESWIVEEIPAAAARLHPAIDAAAPFMLAGLSMGGFAALRLGARYPGRVSAAAALSPIVRVADFDWYTSDDRSDWQVETSLFEALSSARLLPRLRVACGLSDPLIDDARAMHRDLARIGIAHEYNEDAGGHDWSTWSAQLPATLHFLLNHIDCEPAFVQCD